MSEAHEGSDGTIRMRPVEVDPARVAWIKCQREAGWPDVHPEEFCHRCGGANPFWHTDYSTWHTATAAWAAETGREGICCPSCLAEMFEQATGERPYWSWTVYAGDEKDERIIQLGVRVAELEADLLEARSQRDELADYIRVAQHADLNDIRSGVQAAHYAALRTVESQREAQTDE